MPGAPHQLGRVDQSIVPLQEPLPTIQSGPFHFQLPQELLQHFDNVNRVDSFSLGGSGCT